MKLMPCANKAKLDSLLNKKKENEVYLETEQKYKGEN